jgi:hypothetical protein
MAFVGLLGPTPYRGLNYFAASDAALFGERDRDVEACARRVIGFGTKILLIHGVSGAGKSSFLRAGLIPHLKTNTHPSLHFLPHDDGVVRCTGDPTAELIRELLAVCQVNSLPVEMPPAILDGLVAALSSAIRDCEHPAPALADAVATIASYVPGKLTIVIDQAEEIFTRALSYDEASQHSFFLFLEHVYRRDLDIRIIVALRTEYYGRFRDCLVIGDRSIVPPGRGGIEPYMLHSLRDKEQLKAILVTPTKDHCRVANANPSDKYRFYFAPQLPERIIDDLLRTYPHSSVLPSLQLVGTKLYRELTSTPGQRCVTQRHYDRLKGVTGVVDSYIDDGLGALRLNESLHWHPIQVIGSGITKIAKLQWIEPETVRWRRVLCCLVGRQGGGTVVSLSVTKERLLQSARDVGLTGDVAGCLAALTQPPSPLLRLSEESCAKDKNGISEFSLRHDTVALALDRWREGQDKVQSREKIIRRLRAAMIVTLALLGWAWLFILKDASASREIEMSISKMDAIALDSGPDFRCRLLVLRASLLGTAHPGGLAQNFRLPSRHASTLQILKSALVRTPTFAGTFDAVGFDPTASQVALLKDNGVSVFNLARERERELAEAFTATTPLLIPTGQKSTLNLLTRSPAAVGFLGDLGVGVVRDGMLFIWNLNVDEMETPIDLATVLPTDVNKLNANYSVVEFAADALQIVISTRTSSAENSANAEPVRELYIFRLSADDLRRKPLARLPWPDPVKQPQTGPIPVFAPKKTSNGALPYADAFMRSLRPENRGIKVAPNPTLSNGEAEDTEEQEVDIDIHFADPTRKTSQITSERMKKETRTRTPFGPPSRSFAFNFADNNDVLVFRHTDGPLMLFAIPAPGDHLNSPILSADPPQSAQGNILQPDLPFQRPLIAAAKATDYWRFAWPTEGGIEVVYQSKEDRSTKLERLESSPLLSGQLGGIQLRFNQAADYIFLIQKRTWSQPTSVRIWDLGPERRDRILKLSDEAAERLSCFVASFETPGVAASLSDDERRTYGIIEADGTCRQSVPDVGAF